MLTLTTFTKLFSQNHNNITSAAAPNSAPTV